VPQMIVIDEVLTKLLQK